VDNTSRLHDAGSSLTPSAPAPDLAADHHPSRRLLEYVIEQPGAEDAWQELARIYDRQADTWTEWAETVPDYTAPFAEGLRHCPPAPWAVEVCCGTGQATPLLAAFAPLVLALDASFAMLSDGLGGQNPVSGARPVAADVRALPFPDRSVPLLAALNGVPCVSEFDRVLRADGRLLWCTSFGAGTPLYVEPQRLADLFGPGWTGVTGRAGNGEWTVLHRD
jgi:SAM-dependent methyltransferase